MGNVTAVMPSFFDPDQAIRQFLSQTEAGLPAYVKDVLEAPDSTRLKSAAFADAGRQYPCFDRASTYVSAVNLIAAGLQEEAVYASVKMAARVHGIEADVAAAEAAMLPQEETQVKQACALSVQLDESQTMELYPTGSLYDLEESARGLERDIIDNRIPIDWAKEAAARIVEAAKSTGAELPEAIIELGTLRLADLEKAAKVDAYRSRRLGLADEDAELYADLVKAAAADDDNLETIVALYRELDERLQVKYSSVIPNPYAVFYGGTSLETIEKLASEVVVIDDTLVPLAVVAQVKGSRLKAAFRKDTADELVSLSKATASEASVKLARMTPEIRAEYLQLLLR